MENLAYLHLASTYESPSGELVAFNNILSSSPDWRRLSGKAWRYMLPLAITLSILSAVGSALALERGDQGPSVRSLQQKLKRAGFYQAPITQVFDPRTEDAVRRFQKAANLQVSGVAGPTTIEKLGSWRQATASQPKKPSQNNSQAKKPVSNNSVATKPSSDNFIKRGDEGQQVKILQERLRVAGFYYGNSTGIFGPITQEAVKRFQEAYNLDTDGIAGPATLAKLPPVGVGYGEDAPRRSVTDRDKLRLGDRGEAVRVLQDQLISAGYLEGQPNGYYGPYTTDAVKRFQAANYLAASGIAGPTTRAKLHSIVNTASKSEFDVQEIQRRLKERGFYKGALNGVMGNDTKLAIKQAQQFYGISLNDVKSGRF
jgi:peptidoglycan hydrolase-like protein with peptidoglycan-binding domain